jgi:hypothetical protein
LAEIFGQGKNYKKTRMKSVSIWNSLKKSLSLPLENLPDSFWVETRW